jgi:ribosomal protein S18 acetylase RimI-like enzyme
MSLQQSQTAPGKTAPEYGVRACAPGDLSDAELATCVEIVRDGGAVSISLEKLQNARMLAVARNGGMIVGVGSIKRDRPNRAADIVSRSGFGFPPETPELGYVAVAPQHRRQGLSHQLVGALVKAMPGGLFATTDDQHMMKSLCGASFVRQGSEWPGRRGQLSLWLKQPEQTATEGTSPAASGPAGSLFEGQVGAFFLLSLLVRAEPRGLPGTIIDRIEFQRAPEGHPLDDVIVHAHDAQGVPAVLEVQVKKGITFAPSDPIFRSVVGQIVRASRNPEFLTSRYELAIAISKTSHKIDGPYQDVLTWARELGDAATFMNRINRPGSANDGMRTFVNTFGSHLREEGVAYDYESVWRLLSRLQILVFDFTATGSNSEQLAKERSFRALHPDDASRASELWAVLTELTIKIAASGGDRTRDRVIQDLQQETFRFAGDRHTFSARMALAEASRNALADIVDSVSGAMLTRHERVASVRAALDSGRYVEIRGDAGVGKSGVLKHIADQISGESQVVVLSPGRTVPRGWLAMRGVLGFDGTARDLLSDLAADGGCVLFLDNVDFFAGEERLTAIDLLRESAKIAGVSVIATARREFGVAEPSWLPADVLDQLGRAEPIIIYELSDAETEELRDAAPQLRALLADNHPARPVARNLFRLSRLASFPSDAPLVRTEVEIAEQWWETADGPKDENHRDRVRALRALAEQALTSAGPLDVSRLPAPAVDALVASQSLRDLGNDRVTFRHDVLRDWAIGNLLTGEPALVEKLPLDRSAPAGLARGVELAARMTIEHAADSERWKSFVDLLSKEGNHGSWRWSALLALVRSEIGQELLNRASGYLLDKKAKGLQELIRLVMAVDALTGTKWFSALGFDPKLIPANLNVPGGPSWSRLIVWLLSLGDTLPAAAIPDVVDLYIDWSMGMLGQDPLTRLLVPWLYQWLMEIEGANAVVRVRDSQSPFNGELTREQISALASDLRMGFLTFSNRCPELAKSYLEFLKASEYGERMLRGIIKNSGALPKAAPKELAETTAALLIPTAKEDEEDDRIPFREAFGYHDLDFIPASPSQGPFLQLLIHAPEHGLKLIRQLIDFAISFRTNGRDFGANAITIPSLDGSEITFPWVQSYNWSRDVGAGPIVGTCALMALEVWGHRRIEAGEPVDKVLADVIGTGNPPAAYLLVAVDLLLSHWPKSRVAVIPFLACPELVCLDQQRTIHDGAEIPDIFGLKALQKEPVGAASLASLKSRPSRRRMLYQLLGRYALDESVENRDELAELLRRAAARLGPPKNGSDLGDRDFMAVHALNVVDPKNWHKKTVQIQEGSTEGWEYVPPETETRHLQPLQEAARERHADNAIEAGIRSALNNRERSSAAFATAAIEWARKQAAAVNNGDAADDGGERDHLRSMRNEALVTAAMIAVRDGGGDLISKHEDWIREAFVRALKGANDPVHRVRAGLQFNPVAIAFVGMVLLLKNRFAIEDVRTLLESAGNDDPAASRGFAVSAGLLAEVDERLPRAVLRCSFGARTRPHRHWRKPEAEYNARLELCRHMVRDAIDAELAWLAGKQGEPGWPEFPPNVARPRRRVILAPGNRKQRPVEEPREPEMYADHQAAALWLGGAATLFDVAERSWLRDIVKAYGVWTFAANGSELEDDEDTDHRPTEWNNAFFVLLAYCLPGLTSAEVDEVALTHITSLPEEAFFDVTTDFLRGADSVYFHDFALQDARAVQVRTALLKRIMTTRAWKRHVRERSESTEIHFGPAMAVVLFNDYRTFQPPPECYLNPKGIDHLGPFLPLVKEVAETAQFSLALIALLNLLEVAPRAAHLPVIVAAGKSWLAVHPDNKDFWIDQGIGRRLCSLMETILARDPKAFGLDQPLRKDIDGLSDSLVRMGVAEAHRLEESFRVI